MKKILALTAAFIICATPLFGQSQEEINASKLIQYTNSVIDCSNKFNYKYKSFQTFIKNAQEAYDKYSAGYTPGQNIYVGGYESLELLYNFYRDYDEALAAVPDGVDGKAEVFEAMTSAQTITASLTETAKTLKTYFESAEFVNDDFQLYHTLIEQMVNGYDEMESAWKNAVTLASEYGEKAEFILLKDSPEARYIMAMKGDIDIMSRLVEDIFAMDDDDYNYEPLTERNNAFKETLQQHQQIADGVQMSEVKNIGRFRAFYTHMLNAQKSLDGALKELSKDNPSYGNVNSDLNSFNISFNAAIGSYNDF